MKRRSSSSNAAAAIRPSSDVADAAKSSRESHHNSATPSYSSGACAAGSQRAVHLARQRVHLHVPANSQNVGVRLHQRCVLFAPVALELLPRQLWAPAQAEHELDHRHMLAWISPTSPRLCEPDPPRPSYWFADGRGRDLRAREQRVMSWWPPVGGVVSGVVGRQRPSVRPRHRARQRPARGASWFIWIVLTVILFVTQAAEGATWSLFLPGAAVLETAVVFALSLRKTSKPLRPRT